MTTDLFPRLLIVALMVAGGACRSQAALSVLHAFSTESEGESPQSELTLSGGVLYGSTLEGGAAGAGTLFRLLPTGTGFNKLHEFDGLADPLGEGSFPSGRLSSIGGLLYGTTEFGGAAFDGVVYRIEESGSNYQVIHDFDMDTAPAASPSGGITIDGTTLFGSTLFGSTLTEGAIYQVDADGSGFSVLRELDVDGTEGEEIAGPLVNDAGSLWGVASFGGSHDAGTLFRFDLGTTTLSVLHNYGSAADGQTPVGGLLLNNGLLYGTTEQGGAFGMGTLFRMATDGTGYQTLHDFSGGGTDGAAPVGGLTLVDGRLYGVTREAGPSDKGTVYSLSTNGTDFDLRHAFSGSDGEFPLAGLISDGSMLYGTTSSGGLGGGVVYAIDPQAVHGDYNRDGFVDAADYTVWRDALGSTSNLAADGDFSGQVDEADYGVWAAAYASGSTSLQLVVPEPASIGLLMFAGLVLTRIETRRHQ